MNHDSSQAISEEVSTTPWETIDAEEPVAASAVQAESDPETRGEQNRSTGAPPVLSADARLIVTTDPFDPGDETVPPVPSPAESNTQERAVLSTENLQLEPNEPPVGAPAALVTESPVAPAGEINPPLETDVGSALQTDCYADQEVVRSADPTFNTLEHGQEYLPMPPQEETQLQFVGSAVRTDAAIAQEVMPEEKPVRTADPTSVVAETAPTATEPVPAAIDEDVAQEAAVPAVIEAKSFFAQSIVDADVPSDEDDDDQLILEPEPVWEDPEMADAPPPQLTGASWTIPLLCAGIGLIACCIVIPQADANRRLAYEKMTLQSDLESVQKQVAVNDAFLKKVVDDPSLAERLAQRQLKRVRKGQHVLRLKEEKPQMSPFQITNVAPPPAPPPYKPIGGILATLCYDARTRLYLMGLSMAMIACGLVMGATPGRKSV